MRMVVPYGFGGYGSAFGGVGDVAQDAAAAAAGALVSGTEDKKHSDSHAIFIGVMTGLSVWFITRQLDKIFGGKK